MASLCDTQYTETIKTFDFRDKHFRKFLFCFFLHINLENHGMESDVIVVVMAVVGRVHSIDRDFFFFFFPPFLFLIRTNNSDDVIGTAIIIVLCIDSRYNE